MLKDALKNVKQAGMPIADVELVMVASAALPAAQHFPCKVDNWKGISLANRMWPAWKTAFCLADPKGQRRILVAKRGELLGGAHGVTPALGPVLGKVEAALDNLALAATNDTTILQQLTAVGFSSCQLNPHYSFVDPKLNLIIILH